MKKTLLLSFLLVFSCHLLAAEQNDSFVSKDAFQGKQRVVVTHDQAGEEILAIHASIPMGIPLKEEDSLKSELNLETRKILHKFFSEKPEYRDQDFALEIKGLSPEAFWKENNYANLISKIKSKNITAIKNKSEKDIPINKEGVIKNIAIEYLIPNTVEILKVNDVDVLISLATKERGNGSGQEKLAAYQVATRKAQAALTGFVHGENISTNRTLKAISVQENTNNQKIVRHDITNFDEIFRSVASGALSKTEAQCWNNDTAYQCVAYIKLNKLY